MNLTTANYHDPEVAAAYLSCSQIKAWYNCEFSAFAQYVTGENEGPKSTALLQGSLLDVLLTGTDAEIEEFQVENHQGIYTKAGTIRATMQVSFDAAKRCKSDPAFMLHLSGEHQKIMVGEIAETPVRIMMDCLNPAGIFDLKKITRPDKPLWCDKSKAMVPFWEKWGYTFQSTIYREIVQQVTGDDLPFCLLVVEAEAPHALSGFQLEGDNMPEVVATIERIKAIKAGAEPRKCGSCAWCKTKTPFKLGDTVYF